MWFFLVAVIFKRLLILLYSVNLQEFRPKALALTIDIKKFSFQSEPNQNNVVQSIYQFDHLAGICLRQYVPSKTSYFGTKKQCTLTRVVFRTDNRKSTPV